MYLTQLFHLVVSALRGSHYKFLKCPTLADPSRPGGGGKNMSPQVKNTITGKNCLQIFLHSRISFTSRGGSFTKMRRLGLLTKKKSAKSHVSSFFGLVWFPDNGIFCPSGFWQKSRDGGEGKRKKRKKNSSPKNIIEGGEKKCHKIVLPASYFLSKMFFFLLQIILVIVIPNHFL